MNFDKINETVTGIQYGISTLQQVIVNLNINKSNTYDGEDETDLNGEDETDLNGEDETDLNGEDETDLNGEDETDLNGEYDCEDALHDEQDVYYSVHVLDSYRLGDELIKTCKNVLENVQEMKNEFDEETDRLRVLINKMSNKLPFIDRIKYRAEARGIKLPDFTMDNIPKEAGSFYSDEEHLSECIRLYEEQISKPL
jgi:hypothetical protein